jgi:hypothetical protein
MADVSTLLAELKADSAKRRERVIRNLTATKMGWGVRRARWMPG